MRDKWTIKRVEELHPRVRQSAIDAIEEAERGLPNNVSVRLTSVYRSPEEQDKLYAQGRTVKGAKITNARAYQSFHQWRLALDFVLIIDNKVADWSTTKDRDKDGVPDWMEVVNAFKKRGWVWGGDFKSFKDYPHFEKVYGNSWQQLLSRLKAGDSFKDNGIEYVNLV